MSSKILAAIIACAAFACAPAMSAPHGSGPCRVLGGEKLPAEAGPAAICAAVERAMASRAPTVRYSAEVRVLSKSALSATLVANGKTLPKQEFAVNDRDLNSRSIERFAQAMADEVAKAGSADGNRS
jgi:hypothetical protein